VGEHLVGNGSGVVRIGFEGFQEPSRAFGIVAKACMGKPDVRLEAKDNVVGRRRREGAKQVESALKRRFGRACVEEIAYLVDLGVQVLFERIPRRRSITGRRMNT
jgi:hypothetical protein